MIARKQASVTPSIGDNPMSGPGRLSQKFISDLAQWSTRFIGKTVGAPKLHGLAFGNALQLRRHLVDKLHEPFDFQQEKIVGARERAWLTEPERHKSIERHITPSEPTTGLHKHVLHLSSPVQNLIRQIDEAIEVQIFDTGLVLNPFCSHWFGVARQ